jgi:hypothetical protein
MDALLDDRDRDRRWTSVLEHMGEIQGLTALHLIIIAADR